MWRRYSFSLLLVYSLSSARNHVPVFELFVLAAVDQLQEKEGSEALGKLTATDTDGFSLEELEGSEAEEEEVAQRKEGDQDCTETQVICQSF